MKVVNALLLMLVAVFPYSPWILMGASVQEPLLVVLQFWWVCLAAAAVLLMTRNGWEARLLARAGMAVKLVQIPAYVMWFLYGVAAFLFMGPLMTFLVDTMTIILSGVVGLAAVLRCKREGLLTGKQAVLYGILQFVFFADVISAVILYRKTKEVSL